MAPAPGTETQVRRLVRFYRETVQQLSEEVIAGTTFQRHRAFVHLQGSLARLQELDKFADSWATRNIGGLYRKALRASRDDIAALGLDRKRLVTEAQFAQINRDAVEALIVDPNVGFTGGTRSATKQIRQRIKQIQTQARALVTQQGFLDETISRVGVLEGKNLNTVAKKLSKEVLESSDKTGLVFRPALRRFPRSHIFHQLNKVPFVEFPSGRTMRLDKYVEMLARTKIAQAQTLAKRNAVLQSGRDLVRVNVRPSDVGDACDLFIGRVYALTQEAAKREGVPHVDSLPNGGPPFHPNCKHLLEAFFPEVATAEDKTVGYSKTPRWGLNKSYAELERDLKRRLGKNIGGIAKDPSKINAIFAKEHEALFRKFEKPGKPFGIDRRMAGIDGDKLRRNRSRRRKEAAKK